MTALTLKSDQVSIRNGLTAHSRECRQHAHATVALVADQATQSGPELRAGERGVHDWLVLTKHRISMMSTLTAAMGYVAAKRAVDLRLIPVVIGTMLLAMAASALNEVQERDIDARMPRTRTRPIPSGRISPRLATLVALTLIASGSIILAFAAGASTTALGLLAILWYNGIYTPLKRITAFAVVPGSLIGALPPAMGWAAAGGELGSPALLALCFVFFMWQVPHFWLLALRHQRGYASGGLPTLSMHFSNPQILRLVFTWTAASVAACALLVVFQAITGRVASMALAAAGAWLLGRFWFMLDAPEDDQRSFRAFMDINWFALVVMAAVAFDSLAGI
ncbi:MAG TPA: protoheme IX farnesyltransferase [Polyangiaceae bacterium]|nr:protoheme IX farnesyltransferase [Polyangiaceae bacterium]